MIARLHTHTHTLGYGGNVTSAGWQVILCDPIWHVSTRSGEACGKLLYPVTLLTYFTHIDSSVNNIKRRAIAKILTLTLTYLMLNFWSVAIHSWSRQVAKMPNAKTESLWRQLEYRTTQQARCNTTERRSKLSARAAV